VRRRNGGAAFVYRHLSVGDAARAATRRAPHGASSSGFRLLLELEVPLLGDTGPAWDARHARGCRARRRRERLRKDLLDGARPHAGLELLAWARSVL
jgi:hypothetical protein